MLCLFNEGTLSAQKSVTVCYASARAKISAFDYDNFIMQSVYRRKSQRCPPDWCTTGAWSAGAIAGERTQTPVRWAFLLLCIGPLLAQSGHFGTEFQCPLLRSGHSLT